MGSVVAAFVTEIMVYLNKNVFFNILLTCTLLLAESEGFAKGLIDPKLKQFNPHGSPKNELKKMSIDRHTECKVCHYKNQGEKDIQLKPYMQQRCVACHNPYPHSGVMEHVGQKLSKLKTGLKGKLECLSCHYPHRALLDSDTQKRYDRHALSHLDEIQGTPSFLQIQKRERKLPPGLVERSRPDVMLRRTCTDCHKWGAK